MGIIEKTPESTINMNHWIDIHECGTTCCALGWAAQDLEFIAQGLTLKLGDFTYAEATPRFRGSTGYYAAAEFFDISVSQAYDLFTSIPRKELEKSSMSEKEIFLIKLDALIEGAM
jgi:hypothetical protein